MIGKFITLGAFIFIMASSTFAQVSPPQIQAGAVSVIPGSVDRLGTDSVIFSATFSDGDAPGADSFFIDFRARASYTLYSYFVSDNYQNGQNGLVIVDNGDSTYTASIAWNPPDDAELGYYDLYFSVFDGFDIAIDSIENNLNELLVLNGGENIPPVIPSDNTFATPAGVERIGVNLTTISATYTDTDDPGVSVFNVSFKLRLPDNSSEIILADSVSDGQSGVSIVNDGGGVYTASLSWDPPNAQTLGYYDLYFQVTDGIDISYDGYSNNLEELKIYDAITNNSPTIIADTTYAIPNSVNRIGSEYTMIRSAFRDIDMPGRGAFTVTIKVRDQASAEYTLVNAAKHGEQGLRIIHQSGDEYEATAIWYPPDGQVTGTYDLYFYVEDNNAGSAIDGYANNADELTITSVAILGDGNILRRTNDSDNCGGLNSACHNIANHQTFNCLTCHDSHSGANIYLVRDTIQTPNSGPMPVIFKSLGIGDPFNPVPVVGDPNSGVMGDDSDGVFTGVCEVCHTATSYHRNDGSQPFPNHNNANDCTSCHSHEGGFAPGESAGGSGCTCHNTIFAGMDSSSIAHNHVLANTDANYSPGAIGMYTIKNCLSCHVDHDIFRPDLNPGIGQRSRNLRVDWATDPVQGDNTVLSNSDYSSTGMGGICLSCHASTTCDGCHSSHINEPPGGPMITSSFDHTYLNKADFDAAISTHNYNVSSTFSGDGSVFNANCTKCHNDNMTKSYQSSANKFSLHSSDYTKLLDSTGVSAPSDPLEEKFCFKCHSTTSNPNAGSNLDYYGVQNITNPAALEIETAFSRTYTHPTLTYSGRHSMADSSYSFGTANRHAECEDCHGVHSVLQGTHDGSSNLVSNALKGAWGVEPAAWPAPPTLSDNGNVFAAPASYSKVDPAQKEYQICLKCHSNYTTLPSGARNLAEEINPNYPSTHGISQPGTNAYCNTNTMYEPWASSGVAWCSDCHRSNISSDPEGPHGSNMEHLLVATTTSSNIVGTPLCLVCHQSQVYWDDTGSSAPSRFQDHPPDKSDHKDRGRNKGCFACHMWEFSSTPGLGVQTVDDITAGEIFVHGMNKKWVFDETDGSAGTGQLNDCFTNGYIENMDYTNRRCWSSVCKNHSDKGY